MGGTGCVEMGLSLMYGHCFHEMVLAVLRGHHFGRSPHGFCPGWRNGSPGTSKSCSRRGMGSVLVFLCCGAREMHFFPFGITESAKLGFRLLIFDPLVFIHFQGAAAAAADRGSPPPPGARRGSVVGLIMCSCLRSEESKQEAGG